MHGPRRIVAFGPYELDLDNGELQCNGARLHLRPQAAKVLCALASRPGELVTRQELRDWVWPDTHVQFDQGLNVCIRQVRKALGDDRQATYVQTVPKRGYRLVATVVPSQASGWLRSSQATQANPAPRSWERANGRPKKRRPVAEAILLTIAVAVGLLVLGRERRIASPEARDHFLKGQRLLLEFRSPRAARHLEAAARLEPNNAAAHALLARARLINGNIVQAEMAAARGLALAPLLAEAHAAAGEVAALGQWRWPIALNNYERALRLSPRSAQVRMSYARILSLLGRHGEAVGEVAHAARLDPIAPFLTGDAAWIYYYARQFRAAAASARETLRLTRNPAVAYCLVLALEGDGRLEEARAEAASLARRYRADSATLRAISADDPAEGLGAFWRWDAGQMKASENRERLAVELAAAFVRDGMADSAMAWVRTAIARRLAEAPSIAVDPRFDRLRSKPLFVRAIDQMGNIAPTLRDADLRKKS